MIGWVRREISLYMESTNTPALELTPELIRAALAQNGRKAGLRAAAVLTPAQRSERARRASLIYWAGVRRARKEARKREIDALVASQPIVPVASTIR